MAMGYLALPDVVVRTLTTRLRKGVDPAENGNVLGRTIYDMSASRPNKRETAGRQVSETRS
jgi:hypothetical protein